MVIVAVELIVDESRADAFATAVAKHRENSLGAAAPHCAGSDQPVKGAKAPAASGSATTL